MTTSASSYSNVHNTIYRQERYDWRRRQVRRFILRGLGFNLLVKVDVQGTEYIPTSGPTLVIMNHIAAIDPFVVCGVFTSRFVVPMTKIENYEHPIVGLMARVWGAFPVRRGEVDRQALESTVALVGQNYPVLIAPEGTRQPAMAVARHGITYLALKSEAVLLPVGLDGTDQFPASLKRVRRAQVTVRIGRPFRFKTDNQRRVPRDTMHEMTEEAMYQLAALLPEHRRGRFSDLRQAQTHFLEFL